MCGTDQDTNDEQAEPKKRKLIDPWGLLSAGLFIVGLATVAGFFSRFWWPLDLASSFRLQYVEAGVIAAIIYALGRRQRQLTVALLVVAVNGILILPMYWGRNHGQGGASCRLLMANVRTSNTAYDRLLGLVRDEAPDIIILEEVNDAWLAALDELRAGYPHYVEYPEDDNFGIALYSKLPADKLKELSVGEIQTASIHATITQGGATWNVIGTHTVPPGNPAYWRWRNEQLTELADYARDLDGHVIVLGDLNTTPWSHYFRRFARDAGLRDAGKGHGLRLSWPTFFPPMGIPVDHCLVSPGIVVRDYRTVRRIGSDHYPVVIDLALIAASE